MVEEEQAHGVSKCGWCITGRCSECHPSGEGWECGCKHPNIEQQKRRHIVEKRSVS